MNMRCMGCALYIRCALSIHQKECRKSVGCALYIGERYPPENTVDSYKYTVLLCHTFDSTRIHTQPYLTHILQYPDTHSAVLRQVFCSNTTHKPTLQYSDIFTF
jgi:DTW domain-containing protein YfiP